jgi:beta-lactamase class A
MIVYSDNTATNLVLDVIGIKSTAETMERMGCPNTKAHSKVYRRDTSVYPDRSARYGIGSTTAAEMVRLCEALHNGGIVSEAASKAMLKHMKACDDKIKIPRFLPEGTSVAFKTGSVDDARTAAGIIATPGGPVALCVLTEKNKDQRWTPDNAGDLLIATISREVYLYFGEQAKIKPAIDEKSPKSASSRD